MGISARISRIVCAAACLYGAATATADGVNWPSFRGQFASGVAEGYPTPVTWNVETGGNIRWKVPIPGLAHSCPVIWDDLVFVTTAVSAKEDVELRVGLYGDVEPVGEDEVHAWKLYCLDKATGGVVWEKTACTGVPKVKRHPKSSHANSTPATDGRHVVAFFGSEGLYSYDMSGKLLWQKDLGLLDSGWFSQPSAQWGFGSSPIIHDGRVVIQCDVQQDSFLAAFDVQTGDEVWRAPRDEVPTWSTPTIYTHDSTTRIAVNGYRHIGGYDLATGHEVWRMKGGGDIPTPTPVVGHGLIYLTNAHGRLMPVYAVKADATHDVSLEGDATQNDAVAWSYAREGCYMPTPIVYGDHLYLCRDGGSLVCYEAETGREVYRERVEGPFTASPVAADGKLYLTAEKGSVHVVEAGPEFRLVATNSMGGICMATPAISEGMLLFRTKDHVVAVAAD